MDQIRSVIRLDQLSSSYFVILFLTLIAIAAGFLFRIGVIPWGLRVFAYLVRTSIVGGFRLWERLFAWASWPLFLTIVLSFLFVGWACSGTLPFLTLLCAVVPLFMGVTACLAYMMIDLERYSVARGHKSVNNPLDGQELAANLVRYGQAVGVPLMITSTIGMVGGFAMLNLGLYETIGRDWFSVKAGQPDPSYVDFIANALIVLLKIVDMLDFAKSSHVLDVSYVHQTAWPSTSILSAFRMFFTLVLLQQVFASIRQGQVLSETITDLWNPHESIHERARHALPQHGPGAVNPLLISLGNVSSMTKEHRERLPVMLAAIGPAAIPALIRHLHDSPEHVRAVAVTTLGHLGVCETVVMLVTLSDDASEMVRQCVIDALGLIVGQGPLRSDTPQVPASRRNRPWYLLKRKLPVSMSSRDSIELAVRTLKGALSDRSLFVRARAARTLGQIGPSAAMAAPDLLALLRDEDETVRGEAIKAVRKVGGPSATIMEALVERLQDPSPSLIAAAATELGSMHEAAAAAFPSLVPLLQSSDEFVRKSVADAIGQIGHLGNETVIELMTGLASKDNAIRAQTAEALGTIGAAAERTAPALVSALADPNDMVRAKVVEALGRIGASVGDVAVPGLVRALHDQDNVVSSLAAEALGEMGESADIAIPSLIQSLQHINADVRASAAESLGKLDMASEQTRDGLESASCDDDANVRTQAIHALGLIPQREDSTRQSILNGLQDSNAQVRAACVETIAGWNDLDHDSLGNLMTLLEDANEQVRIQVVRVLPLLGGATPDIITGLCSRLANDTDLVQAAAAQALGELGSDAVTAIPSLVRAEQTGEVSVRERAREAIELIQPEVQALVETVIVNELVESLQQIELDTHVITSEEGPIIIVRVTDPENNPLAELTSESDRHSVEFQ